MHRALDLYANTPPAMQELRDDALVRQYAPIIQRHARRLARRTGCHALFDDFCVVGAVALLEASRRFEAGRDVAFEAFVEHRIRGAMLDELRRTDHLPRRLRQATDSVTRLKEKLSTQLGREPDPTELSAASGRPIEEIAELELLAKPLLPVAPELPDGAADIIEHVSSRERREALVAAISELDERLRHVLALHYIEGFTYREIAQVLGVSEPRVCQLHKRAVDQLREKLVAWEE